MKTVGELIHSLEQEDVLGALKRLYTGENESEEGYREVWAKLRVMQPQATHMTCVLRLTQSFDDPPEPYVDVSGDDGSGQTWALEFRPWAEWLAMPVKVSAELNAMAETEQLAHCLYEMTFAGYDQADIAEQFEEICYLAEEAIATLEAETKAN